MLIPKYLANNLFLILKMFFVLTIWDIISLSSYYIILSSNLKEVFFKYDFRLPWTMKIWILKPLIFFFFIFELDELNKIKSISILYSFLLEICFIYSLSKSTHYMQLVNLIDNDYMLIAWNTEEKKSLKIKISINNVQGWYIIIFLF